MRIVDFPVAVPGAQSLCHRTSVIQLHDGRLQLPRRSNDPDVLAFNNLIAYAPADDAGVVAVALHHRLNILLVARVDESGIVVRVFRRTPAVKSLIDNQHTQRVTGIKESTTRRIMSRTNKIKACVLHLPHLTDLCRIKSHGTQHTVIMMQAGSINQQWLAVKHKTPLSGKVDSADPISDRQYITLCLNGRLI